MSTVSFERTQADGGRHHPRHVPIHGAGADSRARKPTRAPTFSPSARCIYEMATGRKAFDGQEPGEPDRVDPDDQPPAISSARPDADCRRRSITSSSAAWRRTPTIDGRRRATSSWSWNGSPMAVRGRRGRCRPALRARVARRSPGASPRSRVNGGAAMAARLRVRDSARRASRASSSRPRRDRRLAPRRTPRVWRSLPTADNSRSLRRPTAGNSSGSVVRCGRRPRRLDRNRRRRVSVLVSGQPVRRLLRAGDWRAQENRCHRRTAADDLRGSSRWSADLGPRRDDSLHAVSSRESIACPLKAGRRRASRTLNKTRRELNHYWPSSCRTAGISLYLATALDANGMRATPSVYVASLDSTGRNAAAPEPTRRWCTRRRAT